MSDFTDATLKLDFKTSRRAVLLEPIRYEIGSKGSKNWLLIPSNFETDGATVPRLLWWFLPPFGTNVTKAAIIHDYLIYRLKMNDPIRGFGTREAIDREFLTAMLALGLNPRKARLVYNGVRVWSTIKGGISFLGLR